MKCEVCILDKPDSKFFQPNLCKACCNDGNKNWFKVKQAGKTIIFKFQEEQKSMKIGDCFKLSPSLQNLDNFVKIKVQYVAKNDISKFIFMVYFFIQEFPNELFIFQGSN